MGSAPRFQPYLDVPPAPFRWRLGLRPLDLADWFVVDEHHQVELDRKQQILRDHHATAFQVLDGVEPEATEVLDAVLDHLGLTEDAIDPALHPLDAAGRLVQEDLVLLVERGDRLVCGGGSVCFPNRWDLASKIGRTMAEIHAPVAGLNDQLEGPVDGFLARLRPERPFWRLGWGILDTDDLYQPVDGTATPRPTDAGPADHHLRVERETLRRFPNTNCVLFTIRTFVCPIDAVQDPSDRSHLADAVEALPHDVAAYKQLDHVGASIAAWLRGC